MRRLTEQPVYPHVFKAIQRVNVKNLAQFSNHDIRPTLPVLVRMSLIVPLELSQRCVEARKAVLTMLSDIEGVNSLVALLSIDFHTLEIDVKKEIQLRQKAGSSLQDRVLVQSIQPGGLAVEFERSDSTDRIRLVLSELVQLMYGGGDGPKSSDGYRASSLFDTAVYIEEICDVLCIALAELPFILNITDVVESLLKVMYGPWIICVLVANMPDAFSEVVRSLIQNGEKQEEDISKSRVETLKMLCTMNPSTVLSVRDICVDLCRMPSLAILLSLDSWLPGKTAHNEDGDLIAFMSGLLLSNDQQVRNWFILYVRNGQKHKYDPLSSLNLLRTELRERLRLLIPPPQQEMSHMHVVKASTLLRFYCALKGIASLKFCEDEIYLLMCLLTAPAPRTAAGVRFVSLGLCMLFACPSLIASPEHERQAILWIRRLSQVQEYFESHNPNGICSSFGELLLLMAIHFHSQQLSAVCDLVCSTLGMKVPVRPNNLTRIKQIFTQEIFTEQVVTSHAIRVPVTPDLNANMHGFLPVHCIYQLLRSRAFTKHKVPIKGWIYRQILQSTSPLHPVLPALIEVYVTSIIIPSAKVLSEHTNEPITEEEIMSAFEDSVVASTNWGRNSQSTRMDVDGPINKDSSSPILSAQLLLLYYVLLYEDQRMATLRTLVVSNKKVKKYSAMLLSRIPIKHLLHQALAQQVKYSGIIPPLLHLLVIHYPHLCLVEDWLHEGHTGGSTGPPIKLSNNIVRAAFTEISSCSPRACLVFSRLLSLPPDNLFPYATTIVEHVGDVLDPNVPRYLQELYKKIWLKLAAILPRYLWDLSVNALLGHLEYKNPGNVITKIPVWFNKAKGEDNIVADPLHVLRCDPRVFRCPPILEVVLRMLAGALAASRRSLSCHLQEHPTIEKGGSGHVTDAEREELRVALVAAQESAAVQILLESCSDESMGLEENNDSWCLQEVQSLICTHLHQLFIADPTLAKLVHFQGYSTSLLPVTVSGIPSMHICLDFVPELLSQPQLRRQAFAVSLVSQLSLQYALPKALSVARLTINTLSTLLAVLPIESRHVLFLSTLPALPSVCEAFPPLIEDTLTLLTQLGRICVSESAVAEGLVITLPVQRFSTQKSTLKLLHLMEVTYEKIVYNLLRKTKIY